MRRIQTFNMSVPPPDRAAAVAATLRAAGWDPDVEGMLHQTLIDDMLMIAAVGSEARHVAACLTAAGKAVGVHGADTIQQCLNAGLLDEIHVDVAVVLLGSGVGLFDPLASAPVVLGHSTVIPGISVTHRRYPVRKQ